MPSPEENPTASNGGAPEARASEPAPSGQDSQPLNSVEEAALDEPGIALDEWKQEMRHAFESWLDDLEGIPEIDDTGEAPDTPDLYSFFAEWASANAESRKGNRRAAEAFSQWGDTLGRFEGDLRLLRQQLQRLSSESGTAGMSRGHCLVLVELLDRLRRVSDAFGSSPATSWWHGTARWRQAWENQHRAVEILIEHFESLLKKEGVVPIETIGQAFDPSVMTAVAAEQDASRPDRAIIEELARGYRLRGELLRPAQVKVITNRAVAPDAPPSP